MTIFSSLSLIIDTLNSGYPVGFPTETVYGLAANAMDDDAVKRIYALKNRPSFNPLIVHCLDMDHASEFVRFSQKAQKLADAFWPGPLTMVLPKVVNPHRHISKFVSAGLDTLAIRCPGHPDARKILSEIDFPLAAPSANISESVSPTSPLHVQEAFPELPIFDGGTCKRGLESTIIDLTLDTPVILRPGTLTKEDIERCLGESIFDKKDLNSFKTHNDKDQSQRATLKAPLKAPLKSPGQMKRHYAPSIPVHLSVLDASMLTTPYVLLGFGDIPEDLKSQAIKVINLSKSKDLSEAASKLFSSLRELDQMHNHQIAVMPIPNEGIGIAINDRLSRAATPSS